MARVLIIDDDPAWSKMLARMVADFDVEPEVCHTLQSGVDEALASPYDVVMLDVHLPDGNGLKAIPMLRDSIYHPEIIIISGIGDPDGAELAINSGAWDYIEKTGSIQQIVLPLIRALEYREKTRPKVPVLLKRSGIVGSSRSLLDTLDKVSQAAMSDVNVLITGETGTGKELFSCAIHENSRRADKNYVIVDCASLSDTLAESILFGHIKGAFTGANQASEGLIKQAHGGTLFLDEIGELPLSVQKSFLRVIQEHQYRPVGSGAIETSNFRLVAATNRDLDVMVKDGSFREDLLFRLKSFVINIPPLRERKEDILPLFLHYGNDYTRKHGMEMKGFAPDFLEAVQQYTWPGNVRELINTIEYLLTKSVDQPILHLYLLPTRIRASIAKKTVKKSKKPQYIPFQMIDNQLTEDNFPAFREFMAEIKDDMEKRYLLRLLAFCDGNKKNAMKVSGLARARFYQLLKKHSLQ